MRYQEPDHSVHECRIVAMYNAEERGDVKSNKYRNLRQHYVIYFIFESYSFGWLLSHPCHSVAPSTRVANALRSMLYLRSSFPLTRHISYCFSPPVIGLAALDRLPDCAV